MEVLPAPISPTSTMLRPLSESGRGIDSLSAVLRVMVAKASTRDRGQAMRSGRGESTPKTRTDGTHPMTRIFLIVVAAGLLILAVGAGFLGAFPPNPQVKVVEKVLPNDRFQGR